MENNNENNLDQGWYSGSYSSPVSAPATSENGSKKKKSRKWLKTSILILLCLIFGAALGIGLMGLFNGSSAPAGRSSSVVLEGKRQTSDINVNSIDTDKLMTAAEVYAENVNSTVGITTSVTTNYWGFQTTSSASGSGFILTSDGYIVTNYHVVEGSDSVSVSLFDGTSYEAEVVGCDASNDVAVLKVDAQDLVPVVLGKSGDLNVGDDLLAIGNPLGELTFSLTRGIVSALDREVTISSGVTMDLIQTDCAINAGNSGGPLFNMYGEVVGITNAKYSSSGGEASIDNICFAIPIDKVRPIIESVIEKGYIAKPYIGVTVMNVSEEAQGYGLPAGASVQSVTEGAPADKAGLRVNDIITAVGETPVAGSSDLVDIISACEKGDELTLTVYRQGETVTLTLTVDEQVQDAMPEPQPVQQQEQIQQLPGDAFGFPFEFFGY